jgi:TPR repeat protein
MYSEGYGVEQDDEQAIYWFRKAAEQGEFYGQWELGRRYRFGDGVEQSDEQAVCWFRNAAEQGNVDSQQALKILGIDWKK